MKVPKIKNWLNEADQHGNVTVLYPGGFKPLTGGHLSLIARYAENPMVKEVKVIIGPKERNGITQDLAVTISRELTKRFHNVRVEKSKYPSPILTAYKEVETMMPGSYTLASSTKGNDYKRVQDFIAQHQEGGKYHGGVPQGVSIVKLPVDVEPALFITGPHKGEPISASTLRKDLADDNYEGFASGYPENSEEEIKNVWNLINGDVNESTKPKVVNELKTRITSKKNRHMTHAEDLVVLSGSEGLKWVLKMMEGLYTDLKGSTPKSDMKLSVKIDGAPAIFAWSDFSDEVPKNGIAMKGLFAKGGAKTYSTPEEVDAAESDRPDLAYKLKTFLKYLPEIGIPKGEIWQGDFLFDNKSLGETEIDDEDYWTFHPNTIFYTVPKKSDLGKLVNKAEIGITWHTRYTGSNLQNIQANYNAEASELTMIDNMLMTDPYVKSFAGLFNFTDEESKYIEESLKELEEYSKHLETSDEYKKLIENKNLTSILSIFQNQLIKLKVTMDNPDGFIGEFIEFIENRASKEASKRKTEKGKDKVIAKFAEFVDDIEQNNETWYIVIHIITEITKLKEMFVKKLNNVGKFQTYLKMKEGGLRNTNQEGFACSDLDGNVVKLVSRGEFSYANFSPDVLKGWSLK